MAKKLVLISAYREINDLNNKIKGNFKIISIILEASNPNKKGFESIYQYMTFIDINPILEKTLSIIKNISCVDYKGKTIKELVAFKNISAWWFLRTDLYNSIYKNAFLIELLKKMIMKERPSEIIISRNNAFLNLVKNVAHAEGVKFNIIEAESSRKIFQWRSSIMPDFDKHLKSIKSALLSIARAIVGISRYFSLKKDAEYLIVTRSHEWQSIRTKQGDIKGDIHFYNVIKHMEKSKKKFLLIDLPKTYDAAKTTFKEKKFPYVFWEAFIILNLLNFKSFLELKRFKHGINELHVPIIKKIEPLLRYDGIDISHYISPKFRQYFLSSRASFYSAARNISMADNVLSKFNIKVTATTEENTACRSFVSASLQRGVKTVGVQHGGISSHSVAYRYDKDEVSPKLSPNFAPLCDITAVYGGYYKNLLVKRCNYKSSKIGITGQPRADSIKLYSPYEDKRAVCSRLKVSHKKEIMLFITQPFLIEKQKEQLLRDVLSAARQIKNLHVIAKLHPGEEPNFIRRIADEVNIKISIVKNVNLYEYLSASSVVITTYSTVVTEALLFKKPVLILGYLGKNYDPSGYRHTKSVLFVDNPQKIKQKIFDLLKDKKIRKMLKNSRKNFISERNFKLDGNSSLRMFNLMKKMADYAIQK